MCYGHDTVCFSHLSSSRERFLMVSFVFMVAVMKVSVEGLSLNAVTRVLFTNFWFRNFKGFFFVIFGIWKEET